MNLPISVVVIRPPANEQSPIFAAANELNMPPDKVSFEETPDGLCVHGLTELDIELAVYELQKRFPEIRYAKPRVAYDVGPPMMEPYYRATVDTPEENLGDVIGDMSNRRGMVHSAREGPIGMQFVAEVPVFEMFGYSTTLRALTRGRGSYTVEFAGYKSVGGDDAA